MWLNSSTNAAFSASPPSFQKCGRKLVMTRRFVAASIRTASSTSDRETAPSSESTPPTGECGWARSKSAIARETAAWNATAAGETGLPRLEAFEVVRPLLTHTGRAANEFTADEYGVGKGT